jgi:hypothetical protein
MDLKGMVLYWRSNTLSPFQSIPHTFWWCIVTITTVGYGDTYPVTWLGKIIGGLTMLMGILVLAFPISLLGANFTDQWKAAAKEKEKRRAMRRLKKKVHIQMINF